MNIFLEDIYYNSSAIFEVEDMMITESSIKDIFQGKYKRLLASRYIYMIHKGEENIGFTYLVDEGVDSNILFLDMGLLKRYQNQGIGTKVLEKLVNMDFDEFIIGETKKNNISTNIIGKRIGVKVADTEDRNFYLLQKDRVEEFIDYNGLEKLSKRFNTKTNKKLIKK